MLAIATRFHGPTNKRWIRYSARVLEAPTTEHRTRRIIVTQDDNLDPEANHHAVARALILKLGWTPANNYGPWVIGATSDGYVYVCDNGDRDRLRLEVS